MPGAHLRASALFRDLAIAADGDRITLGQVADGLGDRTFAALLLVLATPNLIPLIGVSTLLGTPIALVGAQMLAGRTTLWLPVRIRAAAVDRGRFERMATASARLLERFESWLRPRLPALTGATGERLTGAVVLILGIVLALPIPFGNQPPALAICLLALGLMERDGLFLLAGLATALAALAIAGTVVGGMALAALLAAEQLIF